MADLLDRLGMAHPIIQAPMAGVSTPALAAAVSEAGALGSIAAGSAPAAALARQIAEVRARTVRPFNVNLFCHRQPAPDPAGDAAWLAHLQPFFAQFGAQPPATLAEPYPSFADNEELLRLLLDARPPVISFHFGLPPAAALTALRATGAVLLACATTLAEARQAEAAGIDAVVAQGAEAGGHRGVFHPELGDAGLGTLPLTRLLVRELGVRVIAAGGIMDGAGIAAVRRLGAAAAQLGTAFVACPESAADAAYRARLLSLDQPPTVISSVLSGRPARGFLTRLVQEVDTPGRAAVAAYPRAYEAARALITVAKAQGEADFAVQWAGQGAPLARALPAAELVRALVAELQAAGG
ncbi:NAD(P)H-dependent flavin oxidoreductase [Hymenobacter jeollabukensis]|uniref:Nitronate monooxygenase n=1 Tax=Hymenobacter jeollabukensis TaxID=2025313 RepID=A0A5R8WKG0_9BACT|nr:nitronate monooxygenase [Hymenobacter jeollabukensis]TLM89499.1 nitronate monooxygenase [Hymenobacter jeollabukensis]